MTPQARELRVQAVSDASISLEGAYLPLCRLFQLYMMDLPLGRLHQLLVVFQP